MRKGHKRKMYEKYYGKPYKEKDTKKSEEEIKK